LWFLSLILFNEIIDECTTEMENRIYNNTKKSETFTGIGLSPPFISYRHFKNIRI